MKKLIAMACGILLTASLVAYAATNMDEKKQATEQASCTAAASDKSSTDATSCDVTLCEPEDCVPGCCTSCCKK